MKKPSKQQKEEQKLKKLEKHYQNSEQSRKKILKEDNRPEGISYCILQDIKQLIEDGKSLTTVHAMLQTRYNMKTGKTRKKFIQNALNDMFGSINGDSLRLLNTIRLENIYSHAVASDQLKHALSALDMEHKLYDLYKVKVEHEVKDIIKVKFAD